LINTILARYAIGKGCHEAYRLVRHCFLHHGRITQLILNDFDLAEWRYDQKEDRSPKMPNLEGWLAKTAAIRHAILDVDCRNYSIWRGVDAVEGGEHVSVESSIYKI